MATPKVKQIFKGRNKYGNNPLGILKLDFRSESEWLEYLKNRFQRLDLSIGEKPTGINLKIQNDTNNEDGAWTDDYKMNFLTTDKQSLHKVIRERMADISREILELPHKHTWVRLYADINRKDNAKYGRLSFEFLIGEQTGKGSFQTDRKYNILFTYNEFDN